MTVRGRVWGVCGDEENRSFEVRGAHSSKTATSDPTDGAQPWAGVVQDTNGTFYGTTYSGGTSNLGTVYSLSMGLKPFIKINPPAAKVGATVTVLGTNLTGATKVTFGSLAATSFKVVSSSEITAVVPAITKNVKVTVTVPGGSYSTYPVFRLVK